MTYIRFYRGLKAQGIDRRSLPYHSPLQPFASWYAAIGCFLVAIVRLSRIFDVHITNTRPNSQFSGWSVFLNGHWRTDTFVTNYFALGLLPVLYIGAKLWTGVPLVPYKQMDFESGLQEVLDAS